uniref:Arrestin C-terminal-like domain-containing protein n=1 Tax=Periophthalmus magnuspinnatus TaxID=409849 RepID=A0A3B4AI10_9GOBI
MSIKTLTVEYDPAKERGVFSRGETLTGRVVLELAKDTKIECLSVTAKGKASVFWTESYIYAIVSYKAKQHFFSTTKILLERARPESKVLSAGRHVFPFSFDIPDIDLPKCWVGRHGHISYFLEARVSRSMRLDCKERTTFTVTSIETSTKINPFIINRLYIYIYLFITTASYFTGEGLEITTQITNNSKDTTVTPKYIFYEKQSFFCKNKRKVHTRHIVEEKGDPVQAGQQVTQTQVLQIPNILKSTLLNCNIVKQEYRLEVTLDVPQERDSEIKLPLIILLGSPKPQQQKPKRSIWFRKLIG